MVLIPEFKRKGNGSLVLSDSLEALAVKRERRDKLYSQAQSPKIIRVVAEKSVAKLQGDVSNPKHLMGQFTIQFGVFRSYFYFLL